MGSACSCSQSDDCVPSPTGGSSPLKDGANIAAVDQNGHVPVNGDVRHANDVTIALREAKDLVREARKSFSSHTGKTEGAAETGKMAAEMAGLVQRLEVAVDRLERIGHSAGSGSGNSSLASRTDEPSTVPYVIAFDELLSGPLNVFLNCSRQIGGDVAQISKIVEEAFSAQRAFLVAAAESQAPSDADLAKALEPLGKKIQEVIGYRESHRTSPLFNHLSAVSESIPGLSWVAITPAPGPYVKEMGEAAVFYTNRVLKDYRDKDKIHVTWTQNWTSIFQELQAYIKLHHTTGVSWNPQGRNILQSIKAPSAAGGGIPPPPPPGGIPPPPPMVKLEPKPVDDGRGALFEEINQGTDITSSLKKVPDALKTHKNPSLREGPKPFMKPSEPGYRLTQQSAVIEKPPKLELVGKKWFVEYQKDASNIVLDNCKMEHSIYIFRCENTVVQVKGKVNSVILDSCKKSSVVFDNLVSACEIVNCQSCQIQVMDKVPTISIEKTDGCQVYLSPNSLKTEIISAKSSEMNIMIPKADGDFVECPVPEQFKTTIYGTQLKTVITEKKG